MTPALLWPVYGFTDTRYQQEVVATFLDWDAAADFAMQPERYGFEKRSLYIGEARYASKVRKSFETRIADELRFTMQLQERDAA